MDPRLMSLSHLYVVLFVFFFVFMSWSCSRLVSPKLSVVSVVQITLNSHVRNLIEVIRFTLCFICLSLSLSCSPCCLDKLYVLVTNTNLIICRGCYLVYTALTLHANLIVFVVFLFMLVCNTNMKDCRPPQKIN